MFSSARCPHRLDRDWSWQCSWLPPSAQPAPRTRCSCSEGVHAAYKDIRGASTRREWRGVAHCRSRRPVAGGGRQLASSRAGRLCTHLTRCIPAIPPIQRLDAQHLQPARCHLQGAPVSATGGCTPRRRRRRRFLQNVCSAAWKRSTFVPGAWTPKTQRRLCSHLSVSLSADPLFAGTPSPFSRSIRRMWPAVSHAPPALVSRPLPRQT